MRKNASFHTNIASEIGKQTGAQPDYLANGDDTEGRTIDGAFRLADRSVQRAPRSAEIAARRKYTSCTCLPSKLIRKLDIQITVPGSGKRAEERERKETCYGYFYVLRARYKGNIPYNNVPCSIKSGQNKKNEPPA